MLRAILRAVLFTLILVGADGSTFAAIEPIGAGLAGPERTRMTGSAAERIAQIRRTISEAGETPARCHELANLLFRSGRTEEAVKLWRKASAEDRNFPGPDTARAQLFASAGDLAAAEAILSKLKRPEDPHVLITRAQLAMMQGDASTARAMLEQAQENAPDLFITSFMLARLCDVQRDVDTARKFFRRATELAPDRADGWVLLAARLFDDAETDEALEALRRAEACEDHPVMAELRLAEMYRGSNNPVEAVHWFESALEREPDNLLAHFRLGELMMAFSRADEARAHLDSVLQDVESLPALVALAHLEQSQGNEAEAAALYRRALELDPDNAIANNNLAMLLVQTGGDADEAMRCIKRVRKHQPENPRFRNTFGCVLWLAGRHDEALTELQATLRHNATDPWTRYILGVLLSERGRNVDARRHWRGCLLLDNNFSRKKEVQRDLEDLETPSSGPGQGAP